MLKLTYSNLEFQNFPGGPPDTLFKGRGGKGKGGEEREGKDREGRGGTGRDRGGKEGGRAGMGGGGEGRGGEGREEEVKGGALDMGSAPLETSSGSAPCVPSCDNIKC